MTNPDSNVFPPVPADWVASETTLWVMTVVMGVFAITTVATGVWILARTRNPFYLWLCVGSMLACVLGEPFFDVVGGIYIAADVLPMFTLFGRPMPLLDPLVWIGMAPAWYFVYRMIETGMSRMALLITAAAFGVTELFVEAMLVNFNAMLYFSNHSLILGLPVATIAQNFALTLVGGVALHVVAPHLRGFRWLWCLWIPSAVTGAFAIGTTMTGYIAISHGVGPLWGWVLGLFAAYVNIAVGMAAIKLPSVKAIRDRVMAEGGSGRFDLAELLAPTELEPPRVGSRV